MNYITSYDWIQLHCHITTPLASLLLAGYSIEKQKYSTRECASVHIIFKKKKQIATIVSEPHSPVMNPKSAWIKFENSLLYKSNFIEQIKDVLTIFQLKFKNITRLDVCCDFDNFKNNFNPENLIKGFLSEKFLKVLNSKFKVIGEQKFVNTYSYLAFGAESSEVCYKLYNKFLEMEQVKMKPYIMDQARNNGINVEANYWRLEYSLKSSSTKILTADGEILFDAYDLNTLKDANKQPLFEYLCSHYFRFVKSTNQDRKDRMPAIDLFKWALIKPIIVRQEPNENSTRSDKIFANKLMKINQELRGQDFEMSMFSKQLLTDFVYNRGLEFYAKKKDLDIYPNDTQPARQLGKSFREFNKF
jgi:hypothetical protein